MRQVLEGGVATQGTSKTLSDQTHGTRSLADLNQLAASVCFWHKADVQTALMNVRFEGNNGVGVDVT
jgi:hypothetical protein